MSTVSASTVAKGWRSSTWSPTSTCDCTIETISARSLRLWTSTSITGRRRFEHRAGVGFGGVEYGVQGRLHGGGGGAFEGLELLVELMPASRSRCASIVNGSR